jgi:hypothetical protein
MRIIAALYGSAQRSSHDTHCLGKKPFSKIGEAVGENKKALVGFRGDRERAQATSASIKEPSSGFGA